MVTTSAQELPLLQVAGEPSLGSQDRGRTDLPELRAPFRGSMAGARAVLDDDKLKEDAIWALRQAIYANTSRPAQSQKRRDVEDLARRAAGGGDIYRLQERTVLGVPAALRASGFKSADSYMGELRLGHIEARFEVPAWLARTLSQCKRALLRGRGPKNKAAEMRFQDLVADAESLRGDFPSALHWPFRTYVVANRWLLREVEVAGARLAHASISQDERVASLFPGVQGGRPRPRCRTEAPLFLQGLGPVQHLSGPHVAVADRGGRQGERDHPVVGGSVEPALVPDGRLLGAVEERNGGRVAAVGASWRYRGRPLGVEIGSETVRPQRMAHHGDPALGSVGEHASSGVRGGGLRGGAGDGPGFRGVTVAVRSGLGPASGPARQAQGGGRAAGPHLREDVERREAERADRAARPRRLPRHRAGGAVRFGDDGPREPQEASCEGFCSLDRSQPCLVDALWVVFLSARLSTA